MRAFKWVDWGKLNLYFAVEFFYGKGYRVRPIHETALCYFSFLLGYCYSYYFQKIFHLRIKVAVWKMYFLWSLVPTVCKTTSPLINFFGILPSPFGNGAENLPGEVYRIAKIWGKESKVWGKGLDIWIYSSISRNAITGSPSCASGQYYFPRQVLFFPKTFGFFTDYRTGRRFFSNQSRKLKPLAAFLF